MGIPQKNITQPEITPVKIDKFLGINKALDGTTELALGEARECINFRITDGYNLKKMEGYKPLFDKLDYNIIHTIYPTILGGEKMILFNSGASLYKRVNEENILIGSVYPTKLNMFYFDGKVYIQDGHKYRSYDGTELKEVEGYIPKVAINAPPSGGGTPYEQINLLTGQKYMTFSPNGEAKEFVLPEQSLKSIDSVKVNGEEVAVTKNLVKGYVTFDTAPKQGIGTVEIHWTKTNSVNRSYIEECKRAFIFGGSSDTRIFLYGNPSQKNREYFSGVTTKPSAEYFPANNYKDIDTNESAITSMERQYDRQIIFKEDKTWYGTIESSYDALGMLNTDFPAYPLNADIGNVASGQTRVLLNNPVIINKDGIYELVSSSVRDERNMRKISQRIDVDLEDEDLSQIITVDWQERKEYWIHLRSRNMCWIYNYGNDTWYKRDNIQAYDFAVIDGELYFSGVGTIYKFDRFVRSDKSIFYSNTQKINAVCELGFQGFGAEWKKKKIKKAWITLKPESKAYAKLSYETDRDDKTLIGEVEYNTADFAYANFAKFSFLTNLSVKPFRLKLRAKKFAYFSLIIESDRENEKATITSVNLKCTTGGEIK